MDTFDGSQELVDQVKNITDNSKRSSLEVFFDSEK